MGYYRRYNRDEEEVELRRDGYFEYNFSEDKDEDKSQTLIKSIDQNELIKYRKKLKMMYDKNMRLIY